MPDRRPKAGSARRLKADGEKSRSVSAQPVQRSVTVTVTLRPWSAEIRKFELLDRKRVTTIDLQLALIRRPQIGLLLGLPPL